MRVSVGPTALREIRRIGGYLLGQSPQASVKFAAEFDQVRVRLELFPDSGSPTTRPRTRFVMLPSFPYKIFYRRLSGDEVRILRVRHGRRRPLKLS